MKRLISLLLALCLAAALFSGLSVCAAADAPDTIKGFMVPYTVNAGDTLYSICKAKNIDCDANCALICAFSGVNDARYIYAGKTIWLPVDGKGDSDTFYTLYSHTVVSGDTWYSLCKGYGVSYGSCAVQIKALNKNSDTLYVGATVIIPVLTAPVTVVPEEESGSKSGEESSAKTEGKNTGKKPVVDTSFKYVIPVTLKAGDTVAAICKKLGTDFDTYSNLILKINSISGYNSLPVGKLLYIPSNKAPTEGEYFKVMTYTVKSGDTVAKICKENNIDFDSNIALIKKLNPTVTNISFIYVGQKLVIPAPAGSSDKADEEESGEETGEKKAEKETVSSIMIYASDDGEILSMVDGKRKSSASEGAKVTIKVTPFDGKKVKSIVVTLYSSGKSVEVKDGVFVMPNEAVNVKVIFE